MGTVEYWSVKEQLRVCSIFYEKLEGVIGQRKGSWGSKGRDPPGWSGVHRAVNPFSWPRSPRPPPRSLLSALRAQGRDPAEGDTAPGADAAWNPQEESGRRRPLAAHFCISVLPGLALFSDPQDPGRSQKGSWAPSEGSLPFAPFSCARLPGKTEAVAGTQGWAF